MIDKKGQELQIDVYGTDKITSDIQTINLNRVHRLFRNVTKEEITRPKGEVDVVPTISEPTPKVRSVFPNKIPKIND